MHLAAVDADLQYYRGTCRFPVNICMHAHGALACFDLRMHNDVS